MLMPKNLRKPLRIAKTYVFFKNLRIASLHLHPYGHSASIGLLVIITFVMM